MSKLPHENDPLYIWLLILFPLFSFTFEVNECSTINNVKSGEFFYYYFFKRIVESRDIDTINFNCPIDNHVIKIALDQNKTFVSSEAVTKPKFNLRGSEYKYIYDAQLCP